MECLDDGAWIIVHCGPLRNRSQVCDIPFEVKKILDAFDGVTLQVSSYALLPPGVLLGAHRFNARHSLPMAASGIF